MISLLDSNSIPAIYDKLEKILLETKIYTVIYDNVSDILSDETKYTQLVFLLLENEHPFMATRPLPETMYGIHSSSILKPSTPNAFGIYETGIDPMFYVIREKGTVNILNILKNKKLLYKLARLNERYIEGLKSYLNDLIEDFDFSDIDKKINERIDFIINPPTPMATFIHNRTGSL